MKGVIQLTVEVDYNQMITEDKLEALHAYTGKSTEESLRQHHFEQLCKGIVATVDNRPFTRFDIQGSFVPNEIPQEENIVAEEKEVEEEKIDIKVAQEHIEKMGEASRAEWAIEHLDKDIESISLTKGIPTLIKVNEAMKHALENKTGVLVNSEKENSLIASYQGFPVAIEGMEELYIIEYKEYITSETQQYHRTAEELN
ncbi:hypothetical protein [Bacillus paranthracis]|uniref:hypothetical protein n=1 Tax=Bacillus paranthracis TaxID=2026186 RepID=UPI0029C27A37|nr:hypothetical protein [Bacillus paranthracis]MDX6046700.1 hypothetical protein [Bacillus paranthracis]